jgi:hypothetical protein
VNAEERIQPVRPGDDGYLYDGRRDGVPVKLVAIENNGETLLVCLPWNDDPFRVKRESFLPDVLPPR